MGDNNLVDWINEVPKFAKGNFGIFGDVLYEEKVPDEWVNDFEAPAPTRANDYLAAKRLEIQLSQHMARQVQWRDTRSAKFVSFLMDCCTESSIRRVQAQYKTDFEKAMTSLQFGTRSRKLTLTVGKQRVWRTFGTLKTSTIPSLGNRQRPCHSTKSVGIYS